MTSFRANALCLLWSCSTAKVTILLGCMLIEMDMIFMREFLYLFFTGSYGNGAGMRASPIALFTCSKPVDEMKLTCELATRLTHTHIWAVIGALQQCYAVRLALLNNRSCETFDFDAYYSSIVEFVADLEREHTLDDQIRYKNKEKYSDPLQKNLEINLEQKVRLIKRSYFANSKKTLKSSSCVALGNNTITAQTAMNNDTLHQSPSHHQDHKISTKSNPNLVYSTLLNKMNKLIQKCRRGAKINLQLLYRRVAGCGVSSIDSIPMALLAFMIASDPKCANEVNHKLKSKNAFQEYQAVERVIFYAISFGGDTTTIAAMAGMFF